MICKGSEEMVKNWGREFLGQNDSCNKESGKGGKTRVVEVSVGLIGHSRYVPNSDDTRFWSLDSDVYTKRRIS